MRLKTEEIEKIVDTVLNNLKNKKLIEFKVGEDLVRKKMVDICISNFEEEEALDRDAEEILKKYQKEIDSGQVDYRKMLLKVKSQLARERKFIL